MAKTLPIQLVKTRDRQDRFLKESGGSDELPGWVTEQIIRDNSVRLVNELDNISRRFTNRLAYNNRLPLLLSQTYHDDRKKG